MDRKTRRMLEAEIESEIRDLSSLPSGSSEKSKAIESLAILYKLKIDEAPCKNQYFKLGVDVAGIILPLIFYGVWMGRGFEFEKTGTFTSQTFKGLFGRFRPTR